MFGIHVFHLDFDLIFLFDVVANRGFVMLQQLLIFFRYTFHRFWNHRINWFFLPMISFTKNLLCDICKIIIYFQLVIIMLLVYEIYNFINFILHEEKQVHCLNIGGDNLFEFLLVVCLIAWNSIMISIYIYFSQM